jgi:hypothetical protein
MTQFKGIHIPPNGHAGAAQQTPAVRHHIASHMGSGAGPSHTSKKLGHTTSKKRRRTKTTQPGTAHTKKTKGKRRTKKAGGAGATILKAGTAAAKAWGMKMAGLRKKRAKAAGG